MITMAILIVTKDLAKWSGADEYYLLLILLAATIREPATRAIRDFGPSRKRLGRERSSELGEMIYHLSHIYFYNL